MSRLKCGFAALQYQLFLKVMIKNQKWIKSCCVRVLRIFMLENMSWCWAWTRIPGLVFWIRQKLYPPSHPNQPLRWGSVLCYLWRYNISPSLKFEFGRLICAPRRSILNSARQLLGYSILTVNVTDWDFILTVLVEWPGYCILIVHWWPGIILTVQLVTGTSYPDSLLKWPGYCKFVFPNLDLNFY